MNERIGKIIGAAIAVLILVGGLAYSRQPANTSPAHILPAAHDPSQQIVFQGFVQWRREKFEKSVGIVVQDEVVIDAQDKAKFMVGWPMWRVKEYCAKNRCYTVLMDGLLNITVN